MQITIRGPITVSSAKTGKVITSPVKLRKLNRLVSQDSCVNYFANDLSTLDLRDGLVRFEFVADLKTAYVLTLYQSSQKLTDEQLHLLRGETVGQWTDGIGEGEFDEFQEANSVTFDLCPQPNAVTVEQIDLPSSKPKRRMIFGAVRNGNLKGVEKAIEAGEDIESRKENRTPLLIAVREGQVEVAKLLLKHGADVHAVNDDQQAHGVLMTCAVVRSEFLSDDTAAELAEILLQAGADPNRVSRGGHPPLYIANIRGKSKLAAVLKSHGAMLFDTEIRVQTSDGKSAERNGSLWYPDAIGGSVAESDANGRMRFQDLAPSTFKLNIRNEIFELDLSESGEMRPSVITVED